MSKIDELLQTIYKLMKLPKLMKLMEQFGFIEKDFPTKIIAVASSNGIFFVLGFIIIAFVIYYFIEDDPNPWKK